MVINGCPSDGIQQSVKCRNVEKEAQKFRGEVHKFRKKA
jgi:hypothetical protein